MKRGKLKRKAALKRSTTPMKRTALKRGTSQLKRTPLAPVSEKHKAELALYEKAKLTWLHGRPYCEFPGCICRWETGDPTAGWLHHKRRRGKYLCDPRYFCTLCPTHHRWVEDNPEAAERLGLLDPDRFR